MAPHLYKHSFILGGLKLSLGLGCAAQAAVTVGWAAMVGLQAWPAEIKLPNAVARQRCWGHKIGGLDPRSDSKSLIIFLTIFFSFL